MEAEPGIFCFDVFNVSNDLLAVFVRSPDDIPWFWLSVIFVPDRISYQVAGDVVLLSSLDLLVFFWVHVLCGHHVHHVARELAPGYFNGGCHFLFRRVFLCYDTTGSSDGKSLGGAWAILGDDTESYGLGV